MNQQPPPQATAAASASAVPSAARPRALFYRRGAWSGEPSSGVGPEDQALHAAMAVFEGIRALGRQVVDLEVHCRRLVASAQTMGLPDAVTAEEVAEVVACGVRCFAPGADLYIRPMLIGRGGGRRPAADGTELVVSIAVAPLPAPGRGLSVQLSRWYRPDPRSAPAAAKAACLYPLSFQAIREARAAGFDTAVMRGPDETVAEFAVANLFLAIDGVVHTPRPNGCFLDGIVRRRVIGLLRADGVDVVERAVAVEDLERAEEIFATGSYGQVQPVVRFRARDLPIGPLTRRAQALNKGHLDAAPAV